MANTRKVYKTMTEDTRTGNRKGKYGGTTYQSRYKKGKNPAKAKAKAKAKKRK